MGRLRDKNLLNVLGKQIAKVRLEKGYTQKQLANNLDIEISQISRLERGLHNSSITLIFKIAEALEISVKELLDFDTID